MQNSFVTNLLKHIKREDDSDFDFDTKSLSSEAEVQSCLDSGECSAILNYSYEEHSSGRMLAQDSVVDLPILDDPALACTLPQYGQAFLQSLHILFYWFIGIFFYFIVFAYLFTGCKKYKKPLKTDAKSSQLYVEEDTSLDLFAKPEEDVVYSAVRKSNQLITCTCDRNNPC